MVEVVIDRQAVAKRGKRLEYFTIAWNCLEGLVAVIAGAIAGSISLVGFGIDSFIEVTSGATLLWRMAVDSEEQARERNERLSLRMWVPVSLGYLPISLSNRCQTSLAEKPLSAAWQESFWPLFL